MLCTHLISHRYDETILPTDFKSAGQITDDELNATLVRPLGHGVTLHCLIDACHSGTALDLGYRTKVDPQGRFYWKVSVALHTHDLLGEQHAAAQVHAVDRQAGAAPLQRNASHLIKFYVIVLYRVDVAT